MRSRPSFTIGWTDLDGPLRTGESTLLNKDGSVYFCLLSDGIGGGTGDFLYPLRMSISVGAVLNEQRMHQFLGTPPSIIHMPKNTKSNANLFSERHKHVTLSNEFQFCEKSWCLVIVRVTRAGGCVLILSVGRPSNKAKM
jgi:hypothetical protein